MEREEREEGKKGRRSLAGFNEAIRLVRLLGKEAGGGREVRRLGRMKRYGRKEMRGCRKGRGDV